ncbi:hypothetical protein D5S17_04750 [Pseudonocardiaceae bacterium YIM PH 21723]|nr:hypothetical protein D5S17_04750 [Pseudonocardiaceae bacterium YIM PH 21723]
MAETAGWLPGGVDMELPSAARVYDYLLGGGHNFAADRAIGEKFLSAMPDARISARTNRAFLRRSVLFMMQRGIRQFLDIGSGIPTVGNVHEVAQRVDPETKVVYVDNEAVAVAHSQIMLKGNEKATALQEDLKNPLEILHHAETRRLLDFSQPIGLLMVGVFHFVPQSMDPQALLRVYHDHVTPGSYLAISQFTSEFKNEQMQRVVKVMSQSRDPMYPRPKQEIEALFQDFELLEPGVVRLPEWHPDSPTDLDGDLEVSGMLAGVGYRR